MLYVWKIIGFTVLVMSIMEALTMGIYTTESKNLLVNPYTKVNNPSFIIVGILEFR